MRNAHVEPLESRRLFAATGYTQTNLISDTPSIPAAHTDPNLKNPWGVSFAPGGEYWVSDNATGVSSLNDAAGNDFPLVVSIPGAGGASAAPTGQVYNGTSKFIVSSGGASGPALFIFAGEDGGISGWSPSVDGTHAILARDDSAAGAAYKGLALSTLNGKPTLYAADFHNGRIAAFDGSFKPVKLAKSAFSDKTIPAHFAPFNVQSVGNLLYVTYAKQDSAKHDDVAGAGNGYVDVFNTAGTLVRRLQHTADLNSPWGVALAPKNFGTLSGSLLVGNFGSGKIAAYDPATGKFKGLLRNAKNKAVVNPGLWALTFGNGGLAGPTNALFFTAGPSDEADGLFGKLTVARASSAPSQSASQTPIVPPANPPSSSPSAW